MTTLDQARTHFEAGEFTKAHQAAVDALASSPDDVELLRVAGRAGVEAGSDDAVDQLKKVTELQPDSSEAWSDLGDALATEGRMDEANEAFRKAVELNPDDEVALTHLGHTSHATGKDEDAVSFLADAAGRTSGMSTAVISLVEMYKSLGKHEEALAAARQVAEADPSDVTAALDVAELSLTVGKPGEALPQFERLREMEDMPDHEVLVLHGMILAALRSDDTGRARELAKEAAGVQEHGRTRGVLAFLEPEEPAEGEEAETPPSREDVEATLEASLVEHRRLHAEDRRLSAEDLLG